MLSLKRCLTDISNALKNGIVSEKLLWTNSSPSSSFPAQTVALSLSDYDAVKIQCRIYAGESVLTPCHTVKIGSGATNIMIVLGNTATTSGAFRAGVRQVTATTSGVTFASPKMCNALDTGSWYTGGNNVLAPYRIYGIKILGGGLRPLNLFRRWAVC